MKLAIFYNTFNFLAALLNSVLMWFSKLRLYSISIPKVFSSVLASNSLAQHFQYLFPDSYSGIYEDWEKFSVNLSEIFVTFA